MLTFDEKGFIKPYEVIDVHKDEFFQVFVEAMEETDHRKELHIKYSMFVDFLKANFTTNFSHWIGGSFVTQKAIPGDIDVVTFLPHDMLTQKNNMVHYVMKISKKEFQIDAFFAPICKWNHRFYEMSKKIELDWFNNYGFSREDENGVRHPKGIIKINW